MSAWLPGTVLPGTWPTFWNGRRMQLAGLARIDGISYVFAGAPQTPSRVLAQSLLETTPTRSRFFLKGGGVRLVAEFLSPVEPGDLRAQSIPLGYLLLTADSLDGKRHEVQLYLDISGEWAGGADSDQITWAPSRVSSATGDLQAWTVRPSQPRPLSEQNQMPGWGTVVWATPLAAGLTFQSGPDTAVRQRFVSHGRLTNGNDPRYRAIGDDRPVFAFAVDLGRVSAAPVTVPLFIGQIRTPAVSYLGHGLMPLWTAHFSGWRDMLSFFSADLAAARGRADKLDARITADATAAGGRAYAALCAISLRQAYGGTELVVGPHGKPWAFLKEISSDGNVSTVDVIYPASPAWLYADPAYLGLLLEPLLSYAGSGRWPRPYAEHDLGSAYPSAAGHDDGVEENMPVEESGNMLIMTAAYLRRRPEAARGFISAHYGILKQWAEYLVTALPDPGYQNQTDDFAGRIAHSVNLALKGIIAIAAMSQIAAAAGRAGDHARYADVARRYMRYWLAHARDPHARHLDLTYQGDGTWGTVYNGYADRLLGTGLIPRSVRAEQAAWYSGQLHPFGLPLQVPHRYAKTDWEMFTAAWLSDYPVEHALIQRVYDYANTTPGRVPFSDLYNTITSRRVKFRARPVQGGIFALLALDPPTLPGGRRQDADSSALPI